MSLLPELFPASFDDLVFEGRNQAYGAYQLRQAYNGHLRTAMALMIGLCALLLLGGAAWQHLHPLLMVAPRSSSVLTPITPPTYVTEPPKPITPPTAPSQPRLAAAPATHVVASIPTRVVKDELFIVHKPEATVVDVPAETPGIIGATTVDATNTGSSNSTATTGSETGSDTSPAVTGPYVVVEQMPEFTGGMAAIGAIVQQVQQNLVYPSGPHQEGRVFVSFVVQADGTIADITVPKGLGYGLDEEAQRVVRQMPAWTPGQQGHHAVPVRFTLPITFQIQ